MLNELSGLCAGYGGPKAVIQAVKKYASLEEINGRISKAKSELANLETKVSQKNAKYGHMMLAIKMCDTLIDDHGYGLDAIGTILSLAEKYGQPIEILKAIEAFGQLASLEKRVGELSGTVEERQKLLDSLEGQFRGAQELRDELLAKVAEVIDKAGRLEGQFKASENLQRLLNIIQAPEGASFSDHGQVILMLVVCLQRWVKSHTDSFKWPTDTIQAGLKRLIEEMGGTVR